LINTKVTDLVKYRAEIDGLRALAVVPVILFHAGFELFSGGFVGVDVFFVISGYLITTILIEDIENKRFSIANFYERRARRILPALFFVMLVCIPFAWMWMLPYQMKDFSQSLVAVSLFASNILFWRESGYFAAAAEEKPLLHTWSLAVEEQYYVLFPIFLILAWRFGKNRVFWMIVVMAAISLLLSEWGWRNEATANFYLAPTRAWELFAGSIAAFVVQKRGVQTNNPLALTGLLAILFSIFFYDETTPFPSVYALVPVLGVVLLVLYADKETFAAKLLSTKAFVAIGLISYSAYLWHQPLFAFARIRSLEHPSIAIMLVLSLTSLILAYFSWRYIEKPFRNRNLLNRFQILMPSAVLLVSFVIFGLGGHFEKITVKDHALRSLIQTSESIPVNEIECDLNISEINEFCRKVGKPQVSPTILILGDSHAAANLASIDELLFKMNKSAIRIGFGGCTPIKDVAIDGLDIFNKCIYLNKIVYDQLLKSRKFESIVLLSRWTAHWTQLPFDNNEGGIEKFTIEGAKLTGLKGEERVTNKDYIASLYKSSVDQLAEISNLIIVYPIPEAGWNVAISLHALLLDGEEVSNRSLSTKSSLYDERNRPIIDLFDSFDAPFKKIQPKSVFCDSFVVERCATIIDLIPLYYDDDHLSKRGADLLSEIIIDSL
jgi:peptidoglycan/LPS O-acetylase OafA/YrhL